MKIKDLNCPNCNARVALGQKTCEYCNTNLVFCETEPKEDAKKVVVVDKSDVIAQKLDEVNSKLDQITSTDAQNTTEIIDLTEPAEVSPEAGKLAEDVVLANQKSEKRHRIVSSIVSAVTGVAALVSGIILIDMVVYLGVTLIALGILCLCKIFYTFMRARYNMTPAGYTYSAIMCALISGFGIFGGVEMLLISTSLKTQVLAVIPFLLAAVSLSYFITKTVFFVRERHANKDKKDI